MSPNLNRPRLVTARKQLVLAAAAVRRPVVAALARAVDGLEFGEPVTHVYDPLVYARRPHELYLERHARRGIEALFVGMNPGPFGMAQTGVPFGEVTLVREWLAIEAPVAKPELSMAICAAGFSPDW